MNEYQAIALANSLANEAEAEDTPRAYYVVQAANSDQWAVREDDITSPGQDWTIQIWISPELSFPL